LKTPTNPPSNGYSNPTECQAEFLAQGGQTVPGTIYVYITSLEEDNGGMLLGEADNIIANFLMISYGTIGSPMTPGVFSSQGENLAAFAFGKTLIHELGHCLGLYHPFSGYPCDDPNTAFIHSQNPQSPPQINANYGGFEFLVNLRTGAFDFNGFDNRGRDYLRIQSGCVPNNTTPSTDCYSNSYTSSNGLHPGDNAGTPMYSCPDPEGRSLNDPTVPWETFMMIMDYGQDNDRLGFPSFTVNTMRSVLTSHPEYFTVDQVVNGLGFSAVTTTNVPFTTLTPTLSPIENTGLSTGAIAGIIIGSVVGFVIIVILIWLMARSGRGNRVASPAVPPSKAAFAYKTQRMYL